jgi:hypothetical protein
MDARLPGREETCFGSSGWLLGVDGVRCLCIRGVFFLLIVEKNIWLYGLFFVFLHFLKMK